MQNLGLVLLVFGFVCATIATFGFSQPFRDRLIAASIAFLLAAMIFGGIAAAHLLGR
jgi:hypothetical protein